MSRLSYFALIIVEGSLLFVCIALAAKRRWNEDTKFRMRHMAPPPAITRLETSTRSARTARSYDPSVVAHLIDPALNCTNGSAILQHLINGTTPKYNKHKLPERENGTGTEVAVEFWIQEVTSISESTNDFIMDIYINEMWNDPALVYTHLMPCKQNLSLSNEVLNQLWTPNSCFVNSKSALIHDSPFRNVFLMLYPNGTVWVNYRVKVQGPCAMDLTKFPMDQQQCSLTYESFSHNNAEVKMRWNPAFEPWGCAERPVPDPLGSWAVDTSPVYTLKTITLPDFDLILPVSCINKSETYPAGQWDELRLTMTFKRRYVWYFLQAYIPTYLTIFISWISFVLGKKAIPARTMLGVNTLLAMIYQFGNIMRNLPRVSYVKAIDVWMLACMTFIFCSLLELAVIGFMVRDNTPSVRFERRGGGGKRGAYVRTEYGSMKPENGSKARRRGINSLSDHLNMPSVLEGTQYGFSHGLPPPPMLCKQHDDAKFTLDYARYARASDANQKRNAMRQEMSACFYCVAHFGHWLTPDRIDRASCIVFPTLFSLFNQCYWTYYLTEWTGPHA